MSGHYGAKSARGENWRDLFASMAWAGRGDEGGVKPAIPCGTRNPCATDGGLDESLRRTMESICGCAGGLIHR